MIIRKKTRLFKPIALNPKQRVYHPVSGKVFPVTSIESLIIWSEPAENRAPDCVCWRELRNEMPK
jgi:hypothetical protein